MDRRFNTSGFSLIELLIVVSIMMTVLGLVGGAVINGAARAEAQTEVISVYNLVKKAGVRAFTSGQGLAIVFEDDSAKLLSASGETKYQLTFDYLYFKPQKVNLNENGLPDTFSVDVLVNGKAKSLDLERLFQRLGASLLGDASYAA